MSCTYHMTNAMRHTLLMPYRSGKRDGGIFAQSEVPSVSLQHQILHRQTICSTTALRPSPSRWHVPTAMARPCSTLWASASSSRSLSARSPPASLPPCAAPLTADFHFLPTCSPLTRGVFGYSPMWRCCVSSNRRLVAHCWLDHCTRSWGSRPGASEACDCQYVVGKEDHYSQYYQ